MTCVLVIVVAVPLIPAAAATEVRWIAYVRAGTDEEFEHRGAVNVVSSGGGDTLILIDRGALAVDLGPDGAVHAPQEEVAAGNYPPSSSMVTAWIGQPQGEGWGQADAYYYGVAAASDGKLAVARRVSKTAIVPPFLEDGVQMLRSTKVPVLVPPEEPPGTGGLVPSAEEDSYQLLFTNDPAGELAHVEQINVFVSGMAGEPEPIQDSQAQQVSVRGTQGQFFCGASTCFLSWIELGMNYTVGEFGASEEALAFAESLLPMETVAGPGWREGRSADITAPELVLLESGANERLLDSVDGFCECGFRPLDWSVDNDKLLVLAGADGHTTLREYRADGTAEPTTLAEGVPDAKGGVILDAAYGLEGVVVLFAGKGGPPGTLRQLGGSDVLASSVRAFDIEGSTLAYVNASREVIVRDLSTGVERIVGKGAIDVSVAPDLIAGSGTLRTNADRGDGTLPVVLLVVIALAGVALLTGAALLLVVKRRGLD